MTKKINKFVYWTPRILSILFIIFLSLFSLDIFDGNYGLWGTILGLLMHNIPSLVLLIILLISWKHEIVGGIAFILAGLVYIALLLMNPNFEWYMISWSIIIAGPAFLIGVLFLVNWFKKRNKNTNSQKIAVDVALLPPEDIMNNLIEINRRAGATWGPLGKDDFLPHLSLAMGCIETNKLKEIKNVIEATAKKFSPLTVELNELYYVEKPNGARTYALRARRTPMLQQLHENLMEALRPYFTYDGTKDTLYSKSGEEVSAPNFVNQYSTSYGFESFDPHITLRTKVEAGREELPLKFTADQIAACHVGVMTTCRKSLFKVKIVGKINLKS